MAVPDRLVWLPGLVTDTALVMFQVKVAEPCSPAPSVAVTVTEQAQAVVGVPVMSRWRRWTARPAGRWRDR